MRKQHEALPNSRGAPRPDGSAARSGKEKGGVNSPFVAVQAWFCVDADTVASLFSTPGDWLGSFARMAASQGERVGNAHAGRTTTAHAPLTTTLSLEAAESLDAGTFVVHWQTQGLQALGAFAGEARVRSAWGGCIVAIEGAFTPPAGVASEDPGVRIGTEEAIRCLLRELRTALEAEVAPTS